MPRAGAEDPRGDLRWGSIPGLVADAAARFGDAEAVADGDVRLSFAQLERDALRVTGAAMAAGIHPGDRVAMWAPNMAEWIVAALGLRRGGGGPGAAQHPLQGPRGRLRARPVARPGPVHRARLPRHRLPGHARGRGRPHLERIVLLRDDEGPTSEVTTTDEVPIFGWHEFLAGADGVVECDEGVVGAPVDVRAERARWQSVTGDDLSDVIFTSGTTGRPKGAMTTHAQTLRTFATWASIVGLAEGDRYLVVNPFFHTFGYKAGIIACLMQGATIVPEPVFDVDKVLATRRGGAHHGAARPAHALPVDPRPPPARRLRPLQPAPGRDRRGGRSRSSSCERMRSELDLLHRPHRLRADRVDRHRHHVPPGRRPRDHRARPRVAPSPASRCASSTTTASSWPAGEPGEIVVRGLHGGVGLLRGPRGHGRGHRRRRLAAHRATSGSWTTPATCASPTARRTCSSWAASTPIRPRSRAPCCVTPAVAQAAVIGVPDDRMGEVGCAFVVPRPGAGVADAGRRAVAWCRDQMANYKVPRHVEVVDALPTNASGKVLKTELRERFARRRHCRKGA